MPVEVDYDKCEVNIKRNNKIVYSWKFKEFINAKQFQPIVDLQIELSKIDSNKKQVSDEEEKALDKRWFELVTSTGFENSPTHEEALEMMTSNEMRMMASEVFIFLQNWSSTEEARLFNKLLQETKKNEPKPSQTSQTS